MQPTTRLTASLAELKNPSYTGPNRCVPCTLLNVVIAAALSLLLAAAAVAALSTEAGVLLGVVAFAGAVATIYFRGYLIPGTPTFTKRYFPDRLLALFDKAPEPTAWEEVDPREVLLAVGVVVDDPEIGDLTLDPAFADAWERAAATHWTDESTLRRSLGRLAGADPNDLDFEERPHSFAALADGSHLANWPSRAACVADAAGAGLLPDWDPDWEERSLPLQADVLGVLRLFLERCPACEGSVALSQDVVESCCRSRDVVAATCRDCDARLFEMDVDPAMLAGE